MDALRALEQAFATLDLDEISVARWFAGKGGLAAAARFVDAVEMPGSEGGWLVLADVTHADGGIERYLLPTRIGSDGTLDEALPDDPLWPSLARAITAGAQLAGVRGSFTAVAGHLDGTPPAGGRALTDDQSNTSIVLEERLVVKCYRRPRKGTHPEPELLAGLAQVGSKWAPAFGGSLAHHDPGGEETLACVYSFVPGEPVGWERLIVRLRDLLATDDRDARDALADEMGALGAAAAGLHVDLAAAFGIETTTSKDAYAAVAAARAQLDEALALATPELAATLGPRAESARGFISDLDRLTGAPAIRCHGDLHVGQFIASPSGPVVVDYEGEPARPVHDRRRVGSPLRDLACLLLSFDHVAAAAARRLSFGSALEAAFAWSAEARGHAEHAYRDGIVGSSLEFDSRLLRALEVEKECHEVIYAATVLPEWSYAPGLAIGRLLDRPSPA
ncbi:phosphotransferase [Gaiella sp.]|uniref:phosphotransferase n=1 Tax=Gaiella sp. TaxID=2663207 RepID=UPI0032636DAA